MKNTESEELLSVEMLLQEISDAFVSLDTEWRYRFVNDRALSLMNKREDELIGNSIWDVFPEMVGTIFEKKFRSAMNSRRQVSFEAFHAVSKTWFEVRAYPHGSGISIFYTDITDNKKAHEIVEASEKWFHNIANNAMVMIWSSSINKGFNYVNNTWLKFCGRSLQQELGLGWLDSVFEEDRNRVLLQYDEAFNRRVEFRTEYRLLHHDGTYRWVSHAGIPLYNADKTCIGYAGTCIDVNEQVLVYQELERMVVERTAELSAVLEREKEQNIQKSRFVSIASHEFRTPLSTMLSSLGLMEQYLAMNDTVKVEKHVVRIKGSIKHMINILNDFLSLDKLEQGSVQIEKSIFRLDTCLEETIEELQPMLKPAQSISYDYTGLHSIYSDEKMVHNVMLNLLSNAIKYSDEDIRVQVSVDDQKIHISVADQGVGIPEAEQPSLFSKYFRASNVGNVKGTGLGLNIVQRYIELLNGTIHFKSNPADGTTFYVHLLNNNPIAGA